MRRVCIAFFSKGGENIVDNDIVDLGENGFTRQAAMILYEKLLSEGFNPNLFEIKPLVPYDHSYAVAAERSRIEKESGVSAPIEPGPNGFENYDLIFVGFPNWWGSFPSPVATFLRDHDFAGKTVVPFITHGGQRFMYSIDDMMPYIDGAIFYEGFAIAAPYMSGAESVIDKWLSSHKDLLK